MNQPPLNPDAPDSQVSVDQRVEVIETPAQDYPSHGAVTISLHHSERQSTTIQIAERTAESLRDQLNDHLAAALPEVTSVEELVTTRAGLALANAAFSEGLNAGIRSCNAAEGDVPFKKPVSPYSAPLLAMIKADNPEVKP